MLTAKDSAVKHGKVDIWDIWGCESQLKTEKVGLSRNSLLRPEQGELAVGSHFCPGGECGKHHAGRPDYFFLPKKPFLSLAGLAAVDASSRPAVKDMPKAPMASTIPPITMY